MVRMGLSLREQQSVLTASGQNVNLNDATSINEVLKRRQRWQASALDAADACPEINYSVEWLSGICSRVTLYAAEMPEEKDAPPKRTDNSDAIEVFEKLGTFDQRAELQRDIAQQLLITGEPYMIGQVEAGDEEWSVHSVEEVQPSGDTVRIIDAPFDDKYHDLDPRNSTWVRMWRRSPRYRSLATSHLKPLLETVEELLGWDAASRAAGRNRLTMAGLLGIPDNCEVPAEEDDPPDYTGSERFVARIFNAMITAIRNPASATAAVPIVFTYPANESGTSGVHYVDIERPQDDLLERRTERCLSRLARGMNVPPEVVEGLAQATHWGGGLVQDSAYREHGEPLVMLMVNALTVAYFRKRLVKRGVANPNKYLIWFDNSNLVSKPDMGQAADRGAELLMIGPAAWRRERGFNETDAPTPEEEKRMIEILTITRGKTPMQQEPVNPTKPDEPEDDTTVPKENRPGDRTPREQRAVTTRTKGQPLLSSANGRLSVSPADALAIRLQTFGDMAIRRAIERAGAKLRSLANKNPTYKSTIKNTTNETVALTLGRETVTKLDRLDRLFDGSFDHVPAFFIDMAVKTWVELHDEAPPRDSIRKAAQQFTADLRNRAASLLFEPVGFDSTLEGSEVLKSLMAVGML